eukprot:tig00001310_g8161.t1
MKDAPPAKEKKEKKEKSASKPEPSNPAKPAAEAKPAKEAHDKPADGAGPSKPSKPSKPAAKPIVAPPKGVSFASHNWLAIQQKIKEENSKKRKPDVEQAAKPVKPQEDGASAPKRKRRKINLNAEVRKQREEEALKRGAEPEAEAPTATLEPTSDDASATRTVALDCEFVGVGFEGKDDALARVCVVNHYGNVLYDSYVRPREAVVDYRTAVSGILPKHLKKAPDFKEVQARVAELIKGRVLVGHALHNDLSVLLLPHPKRDTRDTAKYVPLRTAGLPDAKPGAKKRIPALRVLAERVLGVKIQAGSHDPTEDARAAMALYRKFAAQWEKELAVQRRAKARIEERERKREARAGVGGGGAPAELGEAGDSGSEGD